MFLLGIADVWEVKSLAQHRVKYVQIQFWCGCSMKMCVHASRRYYRVTPERFDVRFCKHEDLDHAHMFFELV